MEKFDKPTIIIVENCLGFTGGFKAIFQVAEALKSQFRFVFVLPQGSSVIELIEKSGFVVHTLAFSPLQKRLKSIIVYLPMLLINAILLREIVKKEKAVVIHSNDIYNLVPIVTRAILKEVKLLTHIRILGRAFPARLYSFWVKITKKYSDVIIGVSRASIEPFDKHDKIKLIYDGIAKEEVYPYKYNSEANVNNLLYLSNYTLGKGHELAMETFALLLTWKPNLTLTFAGDTFGITKNIQFKNSLLTKAKQLKIDDKIIFHDSVKDVEELFKKSHIFLNLSEAESFSFTCLEALFYGVPCLASNSGGPQEILDNGTYGEIVSDREVEHIAQRILSLLNNPSRRLWLSENGRIYARNRFSFENTVNQMKMIYEE
ncbi:MAG: glycosyltransferase family 4 protein [Sporocytophaga sp.]|nr:glycosyltransferase family 4 protein [Sporocytophaga sp.]